MKVNVKKQFGSIFKHNLLIIIISMVVVSIVFVSITCVVINHSINTQIKSFENEKVDQTITNVNNMLEQMSNVCRVFATTTLIDRTSGSGYSMESYYSYLSILNQLKIMRSVFDSIATIRIGNDTVRYDLPEEYEYDVKEIIDKSLNFGDISSSVISYSKDSPNSIYMSLERKDTQYSRNDVYITIDVIVFGQAVLNEKSGDSNKYITDSDGNIIVSSNCNEIGASINKLYNSNFSVKTSDFGTISNKGNNYFIMSKKVSGLDLYVVDVSNKSIYSYYLNQGIMITIALSVAFVLIAMMVAFFVIKETYKPIRSVIKQVRNYFPEYEQDGFDEVNYIMDNIRSLHSETKELKNEVQEDLDKLRYEQILALQTQMCPHFIYNTLNAINCLAFRMTGNIHNSVSVTIKSMSYILKSYLEINKMFSTMEEEIDLTEKYVDILYARYNKNFEIKWDVDDGLYDFLILKLCIQPLLENAANHAFSEKTDETNNEIKILIKSQNENIKISIIDNGLGIKKQTLEELINSINDLDNYSDKHIGLKNVNRRLYLMYGKDHYLNIESVEGKGTTSSFTIPKKKMEI